MSIDEAARQAGKPAGTVRRWLTEGRKRPDGKHGAFARVVDEARKAQRVDLEGDMTHEEAERIVVAAMRRGSLQAVKLWLALHPLNDGAAEGDPFAEFDPLGFR